MISSSTSSVAAPVAKPTTLLRIGGPSASARRLRSCGLSADLMSTRTGLPWLVSQSLALLWSVVRKRRRLLDIRRQAAHDFDDLQRQRRHQQDDAERQQHQQRHIRQPDRGQPRQPAFDQRADHRLEDERHQPGQEEQQDDVREFLDDAARASPTR